LQDLVEKPKPLESGVPKIYARYLEENNEDPACVTSVRISEQHRHLTFSTQDNLRNLLKPTWIETPAQADFNRNSLHPLMTSTGM
jgi:hypothetical protein